MPVLAEPVISSADSLIALLTAETLLLAALAVVVALSASSEYGPALSLSTSMVAILSFLVVSVVAAGTVAAWWNVYSPACPKSFTGRLEAFSLLVAIVVQPAVAFLIVKSAR